MTIITIYALFGDDIRMLFFTREADYVFFDLTYLAFASFMVELLLSCVAKEDYLWGFYFWLDLLSTLSLIMDFEPVMEALQGNTDSSSKVGSLARASRGARIGTKAGRITRVIRLIRLIRIVKLYKNANQVL